MCLIHACKSAFGVIILIQNMYNDSTQFLVIRENQHLIITAFV